MCSNSMNVAENLLNYKKKNHHMNLRWVVLTIRRKRTRMILFASSKQKRIRVLFSLKRIDYMEKIKFG